MRVRARKFDAPRLVLTRLRTPVRMRAEELLGELRDFGEAPANLTREQRETMRGFCLRLGALIDEMGMAGDAP
jgi:hypothetical protein